jgi:hypothetical protein
VTSTYEFPARSMEAMLHPQLAPPAQAEIQHAKGGIQSRRKRGRTRQGAASATQFRSGVVIGLQLAPSRRRHSAMCAKRAGLAHSRSLFKKTVSHRPRRGAAGSSSRSAIAVNGLTLSILSPCFGQT